MTAMCASSASQTTSTANAARDLVASLRTVVVPGTPATYANRAYLRDLGLRWDPANRRWHGTTTVERVHELRERLGLVVRVFGELEAPPKGPTAPKPASPPGPAPGRPQTVPGVPARDAARRPHDGSRTGVEARVAFPTLEEEEEVLTPTRRFTVWETTSGLPDDCREEDERDEARRLRDLRGRVKAARAVVANTPGLAETLQGDWRKAAMFYARRGISESQFRGSVHAMEGVAARDFLRSETEISV